MAYPLLYQINTRVWLTDLAAELGRPATLDDAPETMLDWLDAGGFDWVWLLGAWQTGEAGRRISRTHPAWQEEFRQVLPDLSERDICGSCFAIQDYAVAESLGGAPALARFRDRLRRRGIKLILDYVPNHVAPDHPWIETHPDYFIQGTEQALADAPQNYFRAETEHGPRIIAHGRDPSYGSWVDSAQLDYANPELQAAMRETLWAIADLCDGVRCDMAMLILPEIFEEMWGRPAAPFWPDTIRSVRQRHPGFLFMAEVYWDRESELQRQGFDYTYDKRLYDRLRDSEAAGVRGHLVADLDYQNRLVRFLENHDEPRAAATFPEPVHQAAAVITYFAPGMRFFHQGQFEGRRVRVPPHLCRAPVEVENDRIGAFYDRLLTILDAHVARNGVWQALDCRPAWEGNDSFRGMIAYALHDDTDGRLVVVVNYAPIPAQCRLPLPFADLGGGQRTLVDLLDEETYPRAGDELTAPGLYIDLRAWGQHVLSVGKVS